MPREPNRLHTNQVANSVLPFAAIALRTGQTETARRLYKRLMEIDPESFQARMGLGEVAHRERAPAEAARWFLAALAYAQTTEQRHDALLAHGRAALDAGHLESARGSFARLTDPQEGAGTEYAAFGLNGVGLTFLLSGDPKGAVTFMEQAVEWLPTDEKLRSNLARALRMLAEQVAKTTSAAQSIPPPNTHSEGSDLLAPEQGGAALSAPATPQLGTTADRIERAVERFEQAAARLADAAQQTTHAGAPPPEARPSARFDIPMTPKTSATPHTPTPATEPARFGPDRDQSAWSDPPAAPSSRDERRGETPRNGADADRDDRAAPATDAGVAPAPAGAGRLPATSWPADAPGFLVTNADGVFVQMGAYAARAAANDLAGRLGRATKLPVGVVKYGGLHRVRVGPVRSRAALQTLATQLRGAGFVGTSPTATGSIRPDAATNDRTATAEPPAPRHPVTSHGARGFQVDTANGRFLQMGAYGNRDRAEALAARLRALTGYSVRIASSATASAAVHRVRIGPVRTDADWAMLMETLIDADYGVETPRSPARSAPAAFVLRRDDGAFIQLGAYAARDTAAALADRLRSMATKPVTIIEGRGADGETIHRVHIGPFVSDARLTTTIAALRRRGYRVAAPQRSTPQDQARAATDAPRPAPAATPKPLARPRPGETRATGTTPATTASAAPPTPQREHAETAVPPPAAIKPSPPKPRVRAFVINEDAGVFIQIGDYATRPEANDLADRIRSLTKQPVKVVDARDARATIHRVRAGPVETDANYEAMLLAVRALGLDLH